jgi:hypothetical protein
MNNFEGYPAEELDEDDDDGTMVKNVETLSENVVGRKIVAIDRNFSRKVPVFSSWDDTYLWDEKQEGTALVLDNGTRVLLADTDDCCAHTELKDVIVNLDKIEHVITGVGTTDGYTKWHIYANLGDVVELNVSWSCGNPFYYGYGFDIHVIPEGAIERIIDEES